MQEEKNGQTPQDEPPPATPDILEEAADAEGQEPSSATQDTMHFVEEPPPAKQDIMLKMLTRADLEKLAKEDEEGEGEE